MKMTCNKKIVRFVDGKEITRVIPSISDKFIDDHKLNHQEVVLLHLLNFGYITNNICSSAYGYDNGESIIRNLSEKYGVQFDKEQQKGLNVVNRYKQQTNYTKYFIKNPELYKDLLQ